MLVPGIPSANLPIPDRWMIPECRSCGTPFYWVKKDGTDGD